MVQAKCCKATVTKSIQSLLIIILPNKLGGCIFFLFFSFLYTIIFHSLCIATYTSYIFLFLHGYTSSILWYRIFKCKNNLSILLEISDADRFTYSVLPRDSGLGEGSWAGLCFSPSELSTVFYFLIDDFWTLRIIPSAKFEMLTN